jgi:hypothetical protein
MILALGVVFTESQEFLELLVCHYNVSLSLRARLAEAAGLVRTHD